MGVDVVVVLRSDGCGGGDWVPLPGGFQQPGLLVSGSQRAYPAYLKVSNGRADRILLQYAPVQARAHSHTP